MSDRRFIESPNFPIDVVNKASEKEKQEGGRPPYWEMVFWWTRKPLAGARAVIAGAVLPESIGSSEFINRLRLNENIPHKHNPNIDPWREKFAKLKLLDPFAGFGSIPLEAIRLGIGEVVAVEFLPTAYIFLKAVLEYPKLYGKQLIDDVKRWGEWIAEKLRKDQDIRELYNEDVAVYIGTWEVKCPVCGRYTPLVGNWWLARVGEEKGGKKIYNRLAWMKPRREGNKVEIEVIDLNEIHGDVRRANVVTKNRYLGRSKLNSYTIEIDGKNYSVQEPNIASGANYATCLLCGNTIVDEEMISELRKRIETEARKIASLPLQFSDAFYRQLMMKGIDKIFKELKERAEKGAVDQDTKTYKLLEANRKITAFKNLVKEVVKEFKENEEVFYPKKALNDWNKKLEDYLEGKITLDELRSSLARPRLLVKVKIIGKDLKFEPATEEDNEKLWRALEKLRQMWRDPDIPTEELWKYTASGGGALSIWTWGFDKFYKLFNPRQLLTLVKLVKLIREAGKRVEEEKLREDWSRKDAFKYAEAVTTYLAIALTRYAGYSNVATPWKNYTGFGSVTALLRAVNIMVFRGIAMTWNWTDYNIAYNGIGFERDVNAVISSLSYLVSAVSGSPSRVRVVLDDARELKNLVNEKFDVIVTDPPYRDDVPYAELSDFYYVWLKRTLSDDKLAPRFHADVLKYGTQWQSLALKEISYNEGRVKYLLKGSGVSGLDYYKSLMAEAFYNMNIFLKDGGVLVTYFAHTHPDAWAELIEAGWKYGGFIVSNGFPLSTESTESIVKRGKLSLDTSVVVVWRKARGERRSAIMDEVREEMLREGVEWAKKVLGKYYGRDLFFSVFTRILSVATRYSSLYDSKGEVDTKRLVEEYVAPLTVRALVLAVSGREKAEEIGLDKDALLYFITKLLYTVSGGEAKVKKLSRDDIILLSVATGADKEELLEKKILVKADDEYRFLEPTSKDRDDFEKLLKARGIDPDKLEVLGRKACSVDLLHMIEYAVHFTGNPEHFIEELKKKYPLEFENARTLARLLVKYLPTDFESKLCKSISLYLKLE